MSPCWTERSTAGRMIHRPSRPAATRDRIALERDISPRSGRGDAVLHDRKHDKCHERGGDEYQARANDHLNSIIRSRCGAAGLLLMEKIGGSAFA